MESKNISKETQNLLQMHISELNSFANLFKACLDICGETDELYTLQKNIKQEVKALIEILDIEICENDFLI